MWYVGIDWADQHHDVVVIDEHGKQLAKKRVAHSAEGLEELVNSSKGLGMSASTRITWPASLKPTRAC